MKNKKINYLIQVQLMSLRAKGEAIPFLRLLRSPSLRSGFSRNDKLLNAFILGRTRNFVFIAIGIFFLSFNPLILKAENSSSLPVQENKISLDLKGAEITEVMRILSLKTNKTIVPSKEVSGRITVFLNNVTLQDILDIILLSQGLVSEKKGDIIYILTNAEYKRVYGKDYIEPRKMETVKLTYAKPANVFNALTQLKSDVGKIVVDEASGTIILIDIPEKLTALKEAARELDIPLETKVFDLNYAKASDAKTQLSAAITSGTGEVIIDERSGKAIITDLPKKMDKLKRIVKELDEETRQVYIEAEIIQVTLTDTYKRGIDWEKVFSESRMAGLDFIGYFPVSPVLSAYQKISVGTVARDKFKTIINLLKTYGNTETLSRPKIAVVNNEEAHIMVGVRDAYVAQTLSQAESSTVTSEQIEFIDVGIKLKVVPTINKDGFITMKIKPEASSVRETITTSLGSRIPIVQTAEAETVLKVKDGTMIMLGGLLEQTREDTTSGLPGISRMPFIGSLFGTRSKEVTKSEVVIFITPHLIRGDTPLKGTEFEKYIPGSVMPPDLKEKLINKNLDEIEKTEEPVKELLFGQGQESYKNKNELSSKEVEAYYKKGLLAQESGSLDSAVSYYQKAISLDKRYAPAFNQLGIVFEAKGLTGEAEKMYLKALEADPDYPPTYSNLALLNEAGKNLDKALEYWGKRASLGKADDLWCKVALKRVEQIKAKIKE